MDEQRVRTALDCEPFYTKLCNPRWLHTPKEHTLEMGVDVEPQGYKLLFRSPRRRRKVIHRRDGCPWYVQGQIDSEYRELRLSQCR